MSYSAAHQHFKGLLFSIQKFASLLYINSDSCTPRRVYSVVRLRRDYRETLFLWIGDFISRVLEKYWKIFQKIKKACSISQNRQDSIRVIE